MADLEVQAVLRVLAARDGKATVEELRKEFDAARKDIDRAEKSIGRAQKSTDHLSGAVKDLKRQLAGLIGLGALTKLATDSVTAFAAYERQLRAIRFELERVDQAAELPRIERFFEMLEANSGVLRQEAARAFQVYIGLTGDVAASMLLVETAAGAANRDIRDFATASTLLGSILQGEVIEPAKSLGIAIDNTTDSAEQQARVLEEAIEKYRGFAGAIEDTRGKLDSLRAGWNEFRLAVGEGLARIAPDSGGLLGFLTRSIQTLGAWWGAVLSSARVAFSGVLELGKIAFDPRNWFLKDMGPLIADAFERATSNVRAQMSVFVDEYRDIWKKGGEESGEGYSEALGTLLDQANERAAANAKKRADADAKRLQQEAEKRAQFERQWELRLLQQRLQMTEEGTQERLAAEMAVWEHMRSEALRQAEETGASVAVIEETFRLAREELIAEHEGRVQELREETTRKTLDMIKKELDAENDALREKWAMDKQEADQARWLAQEKLWQAIATAQGAVDLGRAMFGNTKAVAYAETIVNTARAVMAAAPNVPLMGLMAATGLVQLSKISSTEVGNTGGASFGGGPSGSYAPSYGSARIAPGTSGGLSGVPDVDPTASNRRSRWWDGGGTPPIVIEGNVYGGRQGLKKLAREIDRARRQDGGRVR